MEEYINVFTVFCFQSMIVSILLFSDALCLFICCYLTNLFIVG